MQEFFAFRYNVFFKVKARYGEQKFYRAPHLAFSLRHESPFNSLMLAKNQHRQISLKVKKKHYLIDALILFNELCPVPNTRIFTNYPLLLTIDYIL